MSSAKVLTVLTFKSVDTLLNEGGTQAWVLNRKRVLTCDYVVCARHRQGPWKPEGPEPHKHAFLVGKIRDVVPADEAAAGRWRVEFSEFAIVDGPRLHLESASPTQYFPSLDSLGIDEADLQWQVYDQAMATAFAANITPDLSGGVGSVLMQAKMLVAKGLNVPVEAVEIIVRA